MANRSREALTKSLVEQSTLTGELNALKDVARVVVTEVLGSGSSTSTPAIQLAAVLDMVRTLISDGVFHAASGVLMSVVMHYPDLDFKMVCRGYADGMSFEEI